PSSTCGRSPLQCRSSSRPRTVNAMNAPEQTDFTSLSEHLPEDWPRARLLGRLRGPRGPMVILVDRGRVRDISRHFATVSQFLDAWQGELPPGEDLGPLDSLRILPAFSDESTLRLLSPFDLQCVKACGVTFAVSAVERVIEERARGDAAQ